MQLLQVLRKTYQRLSERYKGHLLHPVICSLQKVRREGDRHIVLEVTKRPRRFGACSISIFIEINDL